VGNFAVETPGLTPAAIQVKDIQVVTASGISSANIIFNQPIDSATIPPSLSVSEVRGTGDVTIRLVEGIDYTVRYNASTNTGVVTFSQAVTSRNLPQVPGKPGPGIYRFEFDQSILRAKVQGVRLDGNGNGMPELGDNFSGDTVVGDAGDKLVAEVDTVSGERVDMYGPVNLDIVMDNNVTSDGQPDPNTTYTVRGFIGDHPDNNTNIFGFAGDADLYSITLQAGQILRLGALQGAALRANVILFDSDGNIVGGGIVPTSNAEVVSLPTTPALPTDLTFPTDFLVLTTGTYIIGLGNTASIAAPGVVPNPPTPPGGLGEYNFTVQVFDDRDSGFSGSTDASNGTDVINAPLPSQFFGLDGVFGTSDDQQEIVIGSFAFHYSKGADNQPNTADDLVTGDNGTGIISTRDGNGRLVNTINSAIGPAGHQGAPSSVTSDVDIFHLNGRNPIAPGTRMTVTVKLADLGADLGSASPTSGGDNRGSVQVGLFDTSASVSTGDGKLVFSPTDFKPNGGKPNTVIADNGTTRYGYDSNGDFFITFVAPDRQDAPGASASFALYIQGTNNTDYQLQVVTDSNTTAPAAPQRQNVLIETNGGSITWLQAGGLTTNIGPFTAKTLGFTSSIGSLDADTYILTNLVAQLNALFQSNANGSGLDVHFSTNPSDFEFQAHSTVFLTSTSDPINPLFDPFAGFNLDLFANNFNNAQPYGVSQHSDALNTNVEDEAVVFVPSFALQGRTPGRTDVDLFVQSLTAAVGRRAGELMGLRITDALGGVVIDPFAANSVDNPPGPGRAYSLLNANRRLSSPFDSVNQTDFFLGQQNSRTLLEKVISQL